MSKAGSAERWWDALLSGTDCLLRRSRDTGVSVPRAAKACGLNTY